MREIRNEGDYQITIDLTVHYRSPQSRIDQSDAQDELTDAIAGYQETIARMIGDLIGLDVEADQVEMARFIGSRALV